MKDATQFMHDHAADFHDQDEDNIDVIRLALNATILGRNNAYSASSLRGNTKKNQSSHSSDNSTSSSSVATSQGQYEHNPPKSMTTGSLSPNTKYSPVETDTSADLFPPCYPSNSKHSDTDKLSRIMIPQEDGGEGSLAHLSAIVEGEGDEEEIEDYDLDYEEASHYANDMLVAESIVSVAPTSIQDVFYELYNRTAKNLGSFSDAILPYAQGHTTEPSVDVTVNSEVHVTADDKTPKSRQS